MRKHFVDRPFTYMLSYLDLEKLCHNSKHENIKASFKDSLQLGAIKTPTLELEDGSRILDTTCRFFTDGKFMYSLTSLQYIDLTSPLTYLFIQLVDKFRHPIWFTPRQMGSRAAESKDSIYR